MKKRFVTILLLALVMSSQSQAANMVGGCGYAINKYGQKEWICSTSSALPERGSQRPLSASSCSIQLNGVTYLWNGQELMETQPGVMGYAYQFPSRQVISSTLTKVSNISQGSYLYIQLTASGKSLTFAYNNQPIFNNEPCY
jgi:hypothetical protein